MINLNEEKVENGACQEPLLGRALRPRKKKFHLVDEQEVAQRKVDEKAARIRQLRSEKADNERRTLEAADGVLQLIKEKVAAAEHQSPQQSKESYHKKKLRHANKQKVAQMTKELAQHWIVSFADKSQSPKQQEESTEKNDHLTYEQVVFCDELAQRLTAISTGESPRLEQDNAPGHSLQDESHSTGEGVGEHATTREGQNDWPHGVGRTLLPDGANIDRYSPRTMFPPPIVAETDVITRMRLKNARRAPGSDHSPHVTRSPSSAIRPNDYTRLLLANADLATILGSRLHQYLQE